MVPLNGINNKIYILMKERKNMKKLKIKYTDEPMGNIRIVADFLPPPKDLIMKKDIKSVEKRVSKKH